MPGAREFALRALVYFGIASALLTETLGALDALSRWPIAIAWVVVALLAIRFLKPPSIQWRWAWFEASTAVAIAAIWFIAGVTAFASAPNSADTLAYHMPRVVYWAQQRSVDFFPTPYFNQIMLQPLAEYAMASLYLLAGSDRFVNFVQWVGFGGCVIAVSSIARELGLSSRGQAFAALFAATLPNAILQASGAKNDLYLAMWIAVAAYFALRRSVLWMAAAIAMAVGVKATALLYLPPLLLFCAWRSRLPILRAAVATVLAIAAVNGPQYWRNIYLSGSPMGFDSAHGDGLFRWRNERLGIGPAVSNAARNLSEQLGSRSENRNRQIYDAVVSLHARLGLDPQDPATTWRWSEYKPPKNANHEADANNRWHLLLLAFAGVYAAFRVRKEPQWLLYAIALAAGFAAFCFYLKWQPFLARMFVPLFILGAPLAAWALTRFRSAVPMAVVSVFLITGARLPLLQNWTRPLQGPRSVLRVAREDVYFYDMAQWDNKTSYLDAVRLTVEAGCTRIGIDASENQLEYPFQALVLARRQDARFRHTGVTNASAQFEVEKFEPCVVLCLDCAGNGAKLRLYAGFGEPRTLGKFLLFLR